MIMKNFANAIRKPFAEFLGVAIFVASIVGTVTNLPDFGLKGLAFATALGLMILLLGPVSGAHLNPAVSLYFYARRDISLGDFLSYVAAQLLGGIAGAWLGGMLFGYGVLAHDGGAMVDGQFTSELVATAVLVWLIAHLVGAKKGNLIPVAVAAWVFAASSFTSSGAVANPAVAFGLVFSPSAAGLGLQQAAWYTIAQILGVTVAIVLVSIFAERKKVTATPVKKSPAAKNSATKTPAKKTTTKKG